MIPEDERIRASIHEAGHAVILSQYPTLGRVNSIEIADNGSGKVSWSRNYCSYLSFQWHKNRWYELAMDFGGFAAEILIMKTAKGLSSRHDLEEAKRKCLVLAGTKIPWRDINLNANSFNPGIMFKSPVTPEQERVLKIGYFKAKELLFENRQTLYKLSVALLRQNKLGAIESRILLQG